MLKVVSLPMNDARLSVVRATIFLVLSALILRAGFPVQKTQAFNVNVNPPCWDIVGQGKQVLVNGVANSGVVNFDKIAGAPDDSYEACVVDPDGNPAAGLFEIHGWAWNDNLGWISFYCPPGAGAKNENVTCSGAYIGGYGVKIDPATGKFSGYAWSDNAGWISFDTALAVAPFTPHVAQVKVDATTPGCQGYVYSGPALPDPSCPAKANVKADTMAWSDNVGWIDFDGILLPWYSLIAEIDSAGVVLSLSPDPSTATMTSAPLANGIDRYRLRLSVHDKKGNAVDPGGRYTVTAIPEWNLDTVKKNQINPAVSLSGSSCPAAAENAVTKPCNASDMASTGSGNYDAFIRSLAPTSNVNGFDKSPADGVMDFSYETFTVPQSLAATPVQKNDLLFKDVLVSIVDNDAGGACVFGTGGTCAGIAKVITYGNPGDPYFKFRPQTNVTSLKDPSGNTDFIQLSSGTPQPFPVTITGSGTVNFYTGIDATPAPTDYGFQFDNDANVGILNFPPGDSFSTTANSSTTVLSAGVGIKPDATTPPPQYIPGLYMYSTVTEGSGGNTVQYYSNKLPKTLGSVAVVPVAVLKGNIYSSGAVATTTSVQAIRSLGDVSTNILRDTVFRNVSKIIAGAKVTSTASATISYGDLFCNGGGFCEQPPNGSHKGTYLLPGSLANTPYGSVYFKGDLHITSGFSGTSGSYWCGQTTLIVIGGNVYIEKDIYNNLAQSSTKCLTTDRPRLGIIVLKDLTASAANQAKQGHVYIDPSVTNIQANIFADGSVFSAKTTDTFDALGQPVYASTTDQENKLKYNQLFIQGSLASQNTVGGSTLSEPIKGDGTKTTGVNKILQSRLYDLNYLRYYTGVLKRDGADVPLCGAPPGTAVTSESQVVLTNPTTKGPWTVYDTNPGPGCLYSPLDPQSGVTGTYKGATGLDSLKDIGATYIYFDPPPANLPGFGTESGSSQKQLPQ